MADSEEITFVGNEGQTRQGEMVLEEDPQVVGQIFTTGTNGARYDLTEITSRFDDTSRNHKFDLNGALHLVNSAEAPGTKVVDLTRTLRERETNHWRPTRATILEPNTKYTLVWRCDAGSNIDRSCNGSGEEIEIKLTNSDSEDTGKSPGWSVANNLYQADHGGTASTHRVAATGSNRGAPSIVSGGVQMYEVQNAIEAGGWDFRAPGDDTYGRAELIVVSVEFSAPVQVNGDTTFRIKIGAASWDLVPVSRRGDTVLFGTLVRSSDNDSDGVWIGDNTATLGHNPAGYIQSDPDDDSDPVNADLTHSSLGTQSTHKVKGSTYRPKVRSIRVASSP